MNRDEALGKQAQFLKANADEGPDEFTIERTDAVNWSRGIPLPVKDREVSMYRIRRKSAEAIVTPDPENELWRIPYVVRYYPGDMKDLLDSLVRHTGTSRIKFVNLSPDGTAKTLSDLAGYPEARDLRDAVNGFEEVSEDWETPSGVIESVDCLIGDWEINE